MLTDNDIVEIVRYLFNLRTGKGEVDDIDHLGNRRSQKGWRTPRKPVQDWSRQDGADDKGEDDSYGTRNSHAS